MHLAKLLSGRTKPVVPDLAVVEQVDGLCALCAEKRETRKQGAEGLLTGTSLRCPECSWSPQETSCMSHTWRLEASCDCALTATRDL